MNTCDCTQTTTPAPEPQSLSAQYIEDAKNFLASSQDHQALRHLLLAVDRLEQYVCVLQGRVFGEPQLAPPDNKKIAFTELLKQRDHYADCFYKTFDLNCRLMERYAALIEKIHSSTK